MHTHLLLAAVALILGSLLLLYRRQAGGLAHDYFGAVTSPFNLAVFRIVLFAVILAKIDMHRLIWFSQLPAALEFAPNHYARLLPYLPVNAALMMLAGSLLLVFCLMALVGLWTPVSCMLTALLGVYVFGVPNLFGKVNHDHHMLWFAVLLAVSPCSDVLSVDAVRRAWARADRGMTAPPEPARAYALPLRFVWLLMGLAYFFPGFWKLWHSGLEWALSGNLKYYMYERWTGIDGSLPTFRIDHYPILIKLTGVATLVFETTFGGLIFVPRIRPLLTLGGLFFHNMTNLFLGILFWAMQWMYVSFVPWDRFFLRLGRRLFPNDLRVRFDGSGKACRRTVAALRVFDVLGRIQWIDGTDRLQSSGVQVSGVQAVAGDQQWLGFAAYRILAARIPLLWPLLPLLSLPTLAALGHTWEQHRPAAAAQPVPHAEASISKLSTRPLVPVGVFLIFAVLVAGVRQDEYTWPIACYPTFDYLALPEKEVLTVTFTDAQGRTALVPPLPKRMISTERYEGLMQSLLAIHDPKRRRICLRAYWSVCQKSNPALAHAADVRFYQDTVTIVPEQAACNPLRRKLLYEYLTNI